MGLHLSRRVSTKAYLTHIYHILTETESFYVRVPATWTTPQVRTALRPLYPKQYLSINWSPAAEAVSDLPIKHQLPEL